ncbi:MAG: Crp/Fnr family transcriptional regulator [Candidatus Sulfotelmatobacter sp.]
MAVTNRYPLLNSGASPRLLPAVPPPPKLYDSAVGDHSDLTTGWVSSPPESTVPSGSNPESPQSRDLQPSPQPHPQEVDPFYLFACHLEWEQREEPSAAWELLAAAQSSHSDTRAHARALLSSSHHLGGLGVGSGCVPKKKRSTATEPNMKLPHDLEIIDNSLECTNPTNGFFCGLSESALRSLSEISHKSALPAGAILFVEGQSPRGTFILCSGKVNLSTTSREGKILILKTAEAGEALGLSATISGVGYESTAETSTPCQLSFLDRNHLLELIQSHSEVGSHAAQCLSRDYQSAYRDIHDLVLTRSSAGKLARLLLSHSPTQVSEEAETRIGSAMTHEEMAQRIGSSRETVTRLLSGLKKKRLIRLDGSTLIIRDRIALEAMAV